MLSASSIFGAIGSPVYAYADDAQDAGIVIEYKNGLVEIISASESGTSYLTESLSSSDSLRQFSENDALAQYAFDAIQSGEGTVTQSVLIPSNAYGYVIANSSDSIMIVSEDAASALAGYQVGEGDALPVTVQKINVAGNDALQDALYQSEDWGVKSTIPEVYALIIVAAVAGVLLIGTTIAGAGFVMLTYFSERLWYHRQGDGCPESTADVRNVLNKEEIQKSDLNMLVCPHPRVGGDIGNVVRSCRKISQG